MPTDCTNTITALLKEIRPEANFADSADYVADGLIDSFDIVTLVATIDKTYAISIPGLDIVPDNFRSVGAINALVQKHRASP